MIKKLILIRKDSAYYPQKLDLKDDALHILQFFLVNEIANDGSYFKKWALSNSIEGSGGNVTELEKEDGMIIIKLEPVFSSTAECRISRDNFLKIIDEWEKICKQKPKEVLIEWDGNNFTIKTKE
jgi:hypothetical protein